MVELEQRCEKIWADRDYYQRGSFIYQENEIEDPVGAGKSYQQHKKTFGRNRENDESR